MEEAPPVKKEQKIFELISDKGNKFIITFKTVKSSSLIITAIFDDGIIKEFYEAEFTIEKIKENKAFIIYDTIEEILAELVPLTEEKKVHIIEEELNLIKVKFDLPLQKYKNLDFILNEKKKSNEEKIDDLYNIIIGQNKEIKNLKLNLDNIKNDIKNLENNLNQLKKGKEIKIYPESNIIKSNEEIDFILNRLKNSNKRLINKTIFLKLLFKATNDGQNASDFHNKCDGKVQQLIFIKTTEGEIFGGYTKIGFRSRGNAIKDNNAFIFSFVTKKIYNVKYDKNAIWDCKEYGPCFYSNGNYAFYIPNKMFDDNSNTCKKSESHFEGMNIDYEINNGEFNFNIQEIEVYQVLYN